MHNKLTNIKGNLIILLPTIIWGTSFVSQKVGVESISVGEFNGIRSILGAAFLMPFIWLFDRKKSPDKLAEEQKN